MGEEQPTKSQIWRITFILQILEEELGKDRVEKFKIWSKEKLKIDFENFTRSSIEKMIKILDEKLSEVENNKI